MTFTEEKAVRLTIRWATIVQIICGVLALGGFTYALRGDVDRLKVGQELMQRENRANDTKLAELTVKVDVLIDTNRRLEQKVEQLNHMLLEASQRTREIMTRRED